MRTRSASVLVTEEELHRIQNGDRVLHRPLTVHWQGQLGKFLERPGRPPDVQLDLFGNPPSDEEVVDVVHLVVGRVDGKGKAYKWRAETRRLDDICKGLESWVLDLGDVVELIN